MKKAAKKPEGKTMHRKRVAAGAELPKQERVVDHVQRFIAQKKLKTGAKLPGERDLAVELGCTRGDVRRALGYLAALGVVEIRHGVGAFLADATAGLGSAPLELLKNVGGFDTAQMFEARRALECELVVLAAARAKDEQFVAIAEELAEMFATVENAKDFLVHDVRFHRAIAKASGNPILAALMEAIAGALYEERQREAGTRENRMEALEVHREMYHAIRAHDAKAARSAMEKHLRAAEGQSVSRDTKGC